MREIPSSSLGIPTKAMATMIFLKKYSLLFIVFLTGACVLIIEVVATRILSPYYGNTIFTVSSIISIVLSALSLGYYFGGKLADKHPSLKIFYSIILIGGASVFLLELLNKILLPFLGYGLSIISGPPVSAAVLFFLPSFFLGMLSPFAIKLQESRFPQKGIGEISGGIFFWSTLGSIFGSLLAGFVLIPKFGISQIVLAVAAVLAVLGLAPLIRLGVDKKTVSKISVFVGIVFLANIIPPISNDNIIYSRDSVYGKIDIFDGEYRGKPVRFLQQDKSISGAKFLDSDELVFDYTKYYELYKIFKPEIRQALVIGGGTYSIPKALLAGQPQAGIDVAEIEPSLFALGEKYFNVPNDSRIKNYSQDGRRFLYETKKQYDFIFSDVYYSLFSIPAHFTTEEFFKIARAKLSEDGIFLANLIGNLKDEQPSLILSEMKTFQSAFPNSYFFAVSSPASGGAQNIIFAGYNSDKKIDFTKIGKNKFIPDLEQKLIDIKKFDLNSQPKLTDNYSPVEYLTARVLKDSIKKN